MRSNLPLKYDHHQITSWMHPAFVIVFIVSLALDVPKAFDFRKIGFKFVIYVFSLNKNGFFIIYFIKILI